MSDAATLARLVEDLTSDLPFTAARIELRLQSELDRQPHSNRYFTIYTGVSESGEGVEGIELREPTPVSIERGKQGLLSLTLADGLDREALGDVFEDLEPAAIAPYPDAPNDLIDLTADRSWGRLTISVERTSGSARRLVLDTAP